MTWLTKKYVNRSVLALVLAPGAWSCASSQTTPELVDAREAYDDAENSPAETHATRELAQARVALDEAEHAHDNQPGSSREAKLAETAEHKANLAEARGEMRERSQDRAVAREQIVGERAENRAEERAEQRQAEARSEAAARDRADESVSVNGPAPVRDREAAAALQNLGQVANVKEEPRGVVITLSGSLLFPSGKQEISPIARRSLDQVAHALKQQPESSTIQVEGHTDDSGSERQNAQLAQQRAQAVADQLVQSGIEPQRINVVGRGENNPIANNDTDEGRATNRRVEIVVADHG